MKWGSNWQGGGVEGGRQLSGDEEEDTQVHCGALNVNFMVSAVCDSLRARCQLLRLRSDTHTSDLTPHSQSENQPTNDTINHDATSLHV